MKDLTWLMSLHWLTCLVDKIYSNHAFYSAGIMGDRDSPRPSVVSPGDETWTTVGREPRNVSVVQKKFQNIKVIFLSQYTKHNSTSGPLIVILYPILYIL